MISIIVPVYNGEDHLDRCVASVLGQTYSNIELILVDDGSTDGTGVLCDAWAQKDRRVRVIHQANAGVSAARNAGMDAAQGDLIGFVDADDWIDADTYRIAIGSLHDCDIVMWDTLGIWNSGRTEPDTIPQLADNSVVREESWTPTLLRWMAGSACRCLYRAELLQDVRFPVGIKLSEDRLFNLQAMGKAKSLRYLKRGLYFRYMRPGSACNRYHGDLFEKNLQAHALAMRIIDQYWSEDYRPVYTRMFIIGGAQAMIRQICSRAYPGKGRLAAIKTITEHPQLVQAFSQCPPQGLREKMLQKKQAGLLLAEGVVYRIRYGG